MKPETKTAYLEAKAAYDTALEQAGPMLDAIDHLFNTNQKAWLIATTKIDADCQCSQLRNRLCDAKVDLLGEFFAHCQSIGADLATFGSGQIHIQDRLIQLALKG